MEGRFVFVVLFGIGKVYLRFIGFRGCWVWVRCFGWDGGSVRSFFKGNVFKKVVGWNEKFI